jgi:hypothetical protein
MVPFRPFLGMSGRVEPPVETPSWSTRFGTAVAGGTLGALLAPIPAMMRIRAAGEHGASLWLSWAALAALTLGPSLLLVLMFRAARLGLRGGPGGSAPRIGGLFMWLALVLGFDVFFGAALRATTHHHALAGVTFAFFTLASTAVAALVARRVAMALTHRHVMAQRAFATLAVLAFLVLASLAVLRVGRGLGSSLPGSYGTALVDAAALLLACLFGAQPLFTRVRFLAFVGPPLALAIGVAGVSALRRPALRESVEAQAPDHARVMAVFRR